MIVVTDPRKVLLTLGWTPKRYVNAGRKFLLSLLKSKALSMACQYGRNPIVWALAKNLMDKLASVSVRRSIVDTENVYKRRQLLRALGIESKKGFDIRPPGMATRLLVQRLYDIPVELQFSVERQLLTAPLAAWIPPPGLFTLKQSENWKYVSPERWVFYEDIAPQPWLAQILDKAKPDTVSTLFDMGCDVDIVKVIARIQASSNRCRVL